MAELHLFMSLAFYLSISTLQPAAKLLSRKNGFRLFVFKGFARVSPFKTVQFRWRWMRKCYPFSKSILRRYFTLKSVMPVEEIAGEVSLLPKVELLSLRGSSVVYNRRWLALQAPLQLTIT